LRASGERLRRDRDELLRGEHAVDRFGDAVVDAVEVEVVDDLRALVAER